MVRTSSGGMIRRLEVAQALKRQPSMLFLDEPMVVLAPSCPDTGRGKHRSLTAYGSRRVMPGMRSKSLSNEMIS